MGLAAGRREGGWVSVYSVRVASAGAGMSAVSALAYQTQYFVDPVERSVESGEKYLLSK